MHRRQGQLAAILNAACSWLFWANSLEVGSCKLQVVSCELWASQENRKTVARNPPFPLTRTFTICKFAKRLIFGPHLRHLCVASLEAALNLHLARPQKHLLSATYTDALPFPLAEQPTNLACS